MSDVASQYGSLIYQLVHLAETLHLHGNALFEMGPLAPPCLVRPYKTYRQKVINAASRIDVALREDAASVPRELTELLGGGVASLLPNMPDLIGSYSDAPAEWHPDAYDAPPRPPLGKLGLVEDEILRSYKLLMDVERGVVAGAPAVVKATEAVAGHWFWRGARSMGGGLLRWANRWCVPLMIIEAGNMLGPSVPEVLMSKAREYLDRNRAPTAVAAVVDEVVADFESDYWPRVAQQWQAMIRIYRASMGNPDMVRSMMAAWDPQAKEKPLPPKKSDYDVFSLANLLGVEAYRPKHQWIAIPILAAGSLGAIVAVGD